MLDAHQDGILQFSAGHKLLELSKLVSWSPDGLLVAQLETAFEAAAEALDPQFGRLILWNSFSMGMEFIAKGVLLLLGDEMREYKPKGTLAFPAYPAAPSWIEGVAKSGFNATDPSVVKADVVKYKTLEDVIVRLRAMRAAQGLEWDIVVAGYELLRFSIRNRDSHAYIPHVRKSHYAVISILCPAVDKLVDLVQPKLAGRDKELSAILELTLKGTGPL